MALSTVALGILNAYLYACAPRWRRHRTLVWIPLPAKPGVWIASDLIAALPEGAALPRGSSIPTAPSPTPSATTGRPPTSCAARETPGAWRPRRPSARRSRRPDPPPLDAAAGRSTFLHSRASSSAKEHLVHTEGVAGSIPAGPTIPFPPMRARSSVKRAPGSHLGDRRFESGRVHHLRPHRLAIQDRRLSRGRHGFESRWGPHLHPAARPRPSSGRTIPRT